MSDAAPPPAPRFRSETCPTCTREVLVDFYHEGAVPQCEFCSGREKGIHAQAQEAYENARKGRTSSDPARQAMERLGEVLKRATLEKR